MGKFRVKESAASWSRKGLPSLAGQRFGRLVVIAQAPHKGQSRAWVCACDCGSPFKSVLQVSLRNGNTKSCGCLGRDILSGNTKTHGMSKTSEYRIWQKIILRCEYPDCWEYSHYGGRGIKICPEWRESFERFFRDMGPRPSMGHTVERINNDGDYCPANCRWATRYEQSMNRRNTRRITANGVTKTLPEWASDLSTTVDYLRTRLKRGWPEDKAVTLPILRNVPHDTRKGVRSYE